MKLLIEPFVNGQRLIEVEPTGSFAHEDKVLWNEKIDGPFPANLVASVGGLVRQGPLLVVDAIKLSDFQAAKAAEASAASAKSTRIAQAKTLLNGTDFSAPLNAAQLTNAVRALVVMLKDVASQL